MQKCKVIAFCTAANICGPLWAPKLFWVCRRAQGGSRPKLGCDPSPIAQCSLALGGISPRSWAYQCTCICACSVTKYRPCITPKIYFGHLIAVGMGCAIVVVAKPLFLISSQLISCGTPTGPSRAVTNRLLPFEFILGVQDACTRGHIFYINQLHAF